MNAKKKSEVSIFDEPFSAPSKSPYNSLYNKYKYSGGFISSTTEKATTQKARGVFFLQNRSINVKEAFSWRVPKHLLFKAGEAFLDSSFNYPVFARPCPTVPRHGFVDSVQCDTGAELNEVSRKAFEAEPEAELLITKPIPASYNAILADGVITFGLGNDGATAGKNVKYFYVGDDPIAKCIPLEASILQQNEVPFYELVIHKSDNSVHLVQVRSAPGVPRCKDYIPAQVEVKNIVKAEGDLLEWEAKLKTLDPKTTIIDHTEGSLASHYAIHAIVNNIPIFTTYLPNIGDVVEATIEGTADITSEQREKFLSAFRVGFSVSEITATGKDNDILEYMRKIMHLSLAALHNFSAVAMNKDYEVLGLVLGLFLRCTFAVSAGESRYAVSKVGQAPPDIKSFLNKLPNARYPAYAFINKLNSEQCIKFIPVIYSIFNDMPWDGGYGGKKWANCTRSSIHLYNACVAGDIKRTVELFNKVITEEHNGGKYLNKVVNICEFDYAAQDPSKFAMRNLGDIIQTLYTAWVNSKNIQPAELDAKIYKPIEVKDLQVGMQSYGQFGITEVSIELKDPKKIKSIIIKAKSLGEAPVTFKNVNIALDQKPYCTQPDCSTCFVYQTDSPHQLYSIPFYWTTENGLKVVSKAKVNILIKEYLDKINKEKTESIISNTLSTKSQDVILTTQSGIYKPNILVDYNFSTAEKLSMASNDKIIEYFQKMNDKSKLDVSMFNDIIKADLPVDNQLLPKDSIGIFLDKSNKYSSAISTYTTLEKDKKSEQNKVVFDYHEDDLYDEEDFYSE